LYDAAGTKLEKKVSEFDVTTVYNNVSYTGNITTTTIYLGGVVYETKLYASPTPLQTNTIDELQFLPQEEGRIRLTADVTTPFVFDYFVKDHLGNVRMVLNDQMKQDVYPAVTFETANLSNESTYYEKVGDARVQPGGSGTNYVQSLRRNTQTIGAGKLMKVMAGDRLNLKVDYYVSSDPTDNSNADGLGSVITSLTSLLSGGAVPVHQGGPSAITGSLNTSGNAFTTFLQPQGTSVSSTMPKAYLNILFFDEQFRFVQEGSEMVQVDVKSSWQTITRVTSAAKEVMKSGYVYFYLSNESNNVVYFDNLQLLLYNAAPSWKKRTTIPLD
jgi:hypothetical protein